jgi:hypothetical protein
VHSAARYGQGAFQHYRDRLAKQGHTEALKTLDDYIYKRKITKKAIQRRLRKEVHDAIASEQKVIPSQTLPANNTTYNPGQLPTKMRESRKGASKVVGSSSPAVARFGALLKDTDEGDDVGLDLLEEAEGTSRYEPESWSELLDYV